MMGDPVAIRCRSSDPMSGFDPKTHRNESVSLEKSQELRAFRMFNLRTGRSGREEFHTKRFGGMPPNVPGESSLQVRQPPPRSGDYQIQVGGLNPAIHADLTLSEHVEVKL